MSAFMDLTGQRFGELVALSLVSPGKWLCRCDCGVEAVKGAQSIRDGKTRSCGCLRGRTTAARNRTHGEARCRGRRMTKEYKAWLHMKWRCTSPGYWAFEHYGARGIRVCDRWMASFEDFLADMGRAPAGFSLDRLDCDRGYEPGNCRWASANAQARNQRIRKNNKSGFRGVNKTANGSYIARLHIGSGGRVTLGTFKSLDAAVAARLAGEERHWCGAAVSA